MHRRTDIASKWLRCLDYEPSAGPSSTALMTIDALKPIDTPELVRGSGVSADKHDDGGVATAAQNVVAAYGKDTDVIGTASEAIDAPGGGADTLVGDEAAVIDMDDDDDVKAHFGFDAVAKVRMDNAAPVRHRVLANSAAYRASAQPDTGFQCGLQIEPGVIDQAIINAVGNPGVALARISGDMALWRDGTLYWPVVIDTKLWGLPLVYLDN